MELRKYGRLMEYKDPQIQVYVRLYGKLCPDSHRKSRIELVCAVRQFYDTGALRMLFKFAVR